VDSKAEYSALSSTRSQKKETKTNKSQCPFNTVQVKIREGKLVCWQVVQLLNTSLELNKINVVKELFCVKHSLISSLSVFIRDDISWMLDSLYTE